MLGDEIGVSAQAVTGALDLDNDGVVKKPVEQGGCHNRIAEHFAPFGKAAIGREDHGAFFISLVDELEEEVSASGSYGQIADLIDNEQAVSGEEP